MSDHPLDPLSADEITAVAETLRREQQLTDRWRFASIELREPPKETVKAFTPGDPIAREARRDRLEPRRRRRLQGTRHARSTGRHELGAPDRGPAEHDGRRVARVRRGLRQEPR